MTMFTGFRNCGGIPILTEFTTERYRAWVGGWLLLVLDCGNLNFASDRILSSCLAKLVTHYSNRWSSCSRDVLVRLRMC